MCVCKCANKIDMCWETLRNNYSNQFYELTAILLIIPLFVVQRTHLTGLEPTRNAVEMKGVVACTPSHSALLLGARAQRVCLALNAQIHNLVATNGAIVHGHVPRPERLRLPLFHYETLRLWLRITTRWCLIGELFNVLEFFGVRVIHFHLIRCHNRVRLKFQCYS